jgi:hypothetical protein
MRDIRLAVRRLAAAPAFTVAAVLTLALGIGANTLTFSAFRGMLVTPLPFSEADRIAWVLAGDARFERWQRDLGGDPSVIGSVLRFADNKAFTVVGILPRGLEFPFGRTPGASTGSGYSVGVQDFWVIGQDRLDESSPRPRPARWRSSIGFNSTERFSASRW